jgi:hypothetical protein
MNGVGTLVGVHSLEVRGVAHDMLHHLNTVAAVHVTANARDVECLAAIATFDGRDHLWRHLPLSNRRPTRNAACNLSGMSASFSDRAECRRAAGRTALRSSPYASLRRRQSSAAPILPQAMPKLLPKAIR